VSPLMAASHQGLTPPAFARAAGRNVVIMGGEDG
jgi:hypothetical protein